MRELYLESYYNGSRLGMSWRKFIGYIKRKKINHDNFSPITTINLKPSKKGIISISLFGNDKSDRFWPGLVEPILQTRKTIDGFLPGWVVRVYISSKISQKVYQALLDADCELVVMRDNPSEPFVGLLWRFLVAKEEIPFLVFDADADYTWHLGEREKNWLNSDKPFIRRRLYFVIVVLFTGNLAAGSWGGKPKKDGTAPIPDIKERLEKYSHDWFGCDEAFLNKEVWPLFKKEGYYDIWRSGEKVLYISLIVVLILVILLIIYLRYRR